MSYITELKHIVAKQSGGAVNTVPSAGTISEAEEADENEDANGTADLNLH